jgi:hypothetical protein
MFSWIVLNFSFIIKNYFIYFIHYNNPPNNPKPPPIKVPVVPNPKAFANKAPPAAVVNGLACV